MVKLARHCSAHPSVAENADVVDNEVDMSHPDVLSRGKSMIARIFLLDWDAPLLYILAH